MNGVGEPLSVTEASAAVEWPPLHGREIVETTYTAGASHSTVDAQLTIQSDNDVVSMARSDPW